MSETDWDTCDQHEFTFQRHTECPYCRIAVLEEQLAESEAELTSLLDSEGLLEKPE